MRKMQYIVLHKRKTFFNAGLNFVGYCNVYSRKLGS